MTYLLADRRRVVCLAAALALTGVHVRADTLLVGNKAEATVSIFALDSGTVVATLPTGIGPHEIGLSPNGRRALISNYGTREAPGKTLTLVDIPTAAIEATIDLGEYRRPHGVVWIGDATALVTAEANHALLEIDVDRRVVRRAIATGQEISHMVVATRDASRAFVANIGSGTVTVIDLVRGEKVKDLVSGAGAEGIAIAGAPGREQLWVTNRAADTVSVFDAKRLDKTRDLEAKGFPIRVVASPDGKLALVSLAAAGTVAVYDTTSLTLARTVAFDLRAQQVPLAERLFGDRFGDSSVPIGIVRDDANRRAWIAHAHADVITEVDIQNGKTLRVLKAGKEPDGMAWTSVDVTPH